MTELPLTTPDQGTSTVPAPLPAGTALALSIYGSTRSGSGATMEAALAAYAASAFADLANGGQGDGASLTSRGSGVPTGDSNIDDIEYLNTPIPVDYHAETYAVTCRGMQYKIRAEFPGPWRGPGSVVIAWREHTINQAGTLTGYKPADGVNPPSTVHESAAESYEAFSETLTPDDGDTYAETEVHTVEATDLELGDTVSLQGPAETSYLEPNFQVAYYEQAAGKIGFLSYTLPEISPGVPANPQPVYRNEAATAAPDAPAGVDFSGAQDTSTGEVVKTFAAAVPGQYVSAANNSYPDPLGLDAMSNIQQAVSVSPTVVEWPGGLIMTLSDPEPASAIMSPVDTALAAIDLAPLSPGYSGSGTVAAGSSSAFTKRATVANRYLPANEQTYTARKGAYSIGLFIELEGGISSLFQGLLDIEPPPQCAVVNSGEIDFAWTRETIDLETGERTSTPVSSSVTFTGDPATGRPIYSAPVTVGATTYFLFFVEDVPSTNQRVEIKNLTISNGTIECLDQGIQARVM